MYRIAGVSNLRKFKLLSGGLKLLKILNCIIVTPNLSLEDYFKDMEDQPKFFAWHNIKNQDQKSTTAGPKLSQSQSFSPVNIICCYFFIDKPRYDTANTCRWKLFFMGKVSIILLEQPRGHHKSSCYQWLISCQLLHKTSFQVTDSNSISSKKWAPELLWNKPF